MADPEGQAFAAYGCAQAKGLGHGTFVIDEKGLIVWSTTGGGPYMDVAGLLERFEPKVASAVAERPQIASQPASRR